MTPEQFAYWLQGFAELNDKAPTQEQWDSIRAHIATVFKKVTPPVVVVKEENPLEKAIREHRERMPYPFNPVDPNYWQTQPVITC